MKERIAVIGSGMMGAGISAAATLAGHETVLYDIDHEKTDHGREVSHSNIDQLQAGGIVTREQAVAAKFRLHAESDIHEAVKGCNLIIEAVTENLSLKQDIFRQLDEIAPPPVLITSNTSGLRISEIVKKMKHPERTATTHFWYPAHLVLLVEIVLGERSDPEVGENLRLVLGEWGKSPVVVRRDRPGQLANRILQAIIREAVYIIESGLASPEDVDTAIKAGMALRFPVWGPLEHIDGVGLDLALSVQRDVLQDLSNSDTPSPYLEDLCEKGSLGFKTGKGFYDWSRKSMDRLADCRDNFIMQTVKNLKEMKDRGTCP